MFGTSPRPVVSGQFAELHNAYTHASASSHVNLASVAAAYLISPSSLTLHCEKSPLASADRKFCSWTDAAARANRDAPLHSDGTGGAAVGLGGGDVDICGEGGGVDGDSIAVTRW